MNKKFGLSFQYYLQPRSVLYRSTESLSYFLTCQKWQLCKSGCQLHREKRENGKKKKSLSGKTQGIWKFCQNTGNFFCSSCKFPDTKGKRYFDICRENSQFFLEAGEVYQVSLVYVIVTNHVNWHRENLQSDREKTGKTQGN